MNGIKSIKLFGESANLNWISFLFARVFILLQATIEKSFVWIIWCFNFLDVRALDNFFKVWVCSFHMLKKVDK